MQTNTNDSLKSWAILEDVAFHIFLYELDEFGKAVETYFKANFNRSQPRIPAGQRGGGQWARVGISPAGKPSRTNVPKSWGKPETLFKHFKVHGFRLGVQTPKEYAKMASEFFQRFKTEKLPAIKDSHGVIRIYDPHKNIFASYNSNGTTHTIYKPDDGIKYYQSQINKHTGRGGSIINPLPSGGGAPGANDILAPNAKLPKINN